MPVADFAPAGSAPEDCFAGALFAGALFSGALSAGARLAGALFAARFADPDEPASPESGSPEPASEPEPGSDGLRPEESAFLPVAAPLPAVSCAVDAAVSYTHLRAHET